MINEFERYILQIEYAILFPFIFQRKMKNENIEKMRFILTMKFEKKNEILLKYQEIKNVVLIIRIFV